MEEKVPEQPESVYAREGTAAHALGELKARYQILESMTEEEYLRERLAWAVEFNDILTMEDFELEEMDLHTDAYVDLIRERMALYPNSQLLLEQRLDTGVPSSWGTSDAVIVSPFHVEIIDFKYGSGVFVPAARNPQLRMYGLGALDTYGDILGDTEIVRITVHQPRLHHVETEEISPDDLRAWRTDVAIPAAELALGDDAPFGPSEDACRWCPASGLCKAQLESVFDTDFDQDPDLLTPEDMSEALARVKAIRAWLVAFEEAALNTAYSEGKEIPGYKVVLSGGRRSVTDPEGALEALAYAGYERDKVSTTKIIGIGALEKLLGDDFHIVEDYVKKSEGRPSLVPESDKRKAIDPNSEAQKEFSE